MVRLTRRTRRDDLGLGPQRASALDGRTQTVWREFKAGITGRKGEALVVHRLSELGLPAMHDIILPLDGVPTQIDHLVRCADAIAVIETKAWSGKIDGSADGPEWFQTLDGGRHWNAVINPLRQNQRHVAAVAAVLTEHGLSRLPLVGHVVMAGPAALASDVVSLVLQPDTLPRLLAPSGPAPVQQAALTMAWRLLRQEASQGEMLRKLHSRIMASRTP